MKKTWRFWIATWFGTGMLKDFLKIGGGTWGSFFSLPLCWGLFEATKNDFLEMKILTWVTAILAIQLAGILSIPETELILGEQKNWRGKAVLHDQSQIVIDEVYGMLITSMPLLFFTIHSRILDFTLVFIFFRIFDTWKIWPTNFFDHMENEWGVMLDDGVAGIYAAICLCGSLYCLNHFFNL